MSTQQNDIVEVNLTLDSLGFSAEEDFSIPAFIAEITNTDERVQLVGSLDEARDLGYDETNEIGKWLQVFYGQQGKEGAKPAKAKILKKLSNANCTQIISFTGTADSGNFKLSLDEGVTETAVIAHNANAATIKAAIEGLATVTEVTVTLAGTQAWEGFTVVFTGVDANTDFPEFEISTNTMVTAGGGAVPGTVNKTVFGSANETWGAAYAACKAVDEGFWFVLPVGRFDLEADVDTLPVLVEADKKGLILLSANAVAPTGTPGDIGQTMLARFVRSFLHFSKDTEYSLTAAEYGATIPDFFGSVNPAMYPLSIVRPDKLTQGEIAHLISKRYARCENINLRTTIPGSSRGSKTPQGVRSTTGVNIKNIWTKDYLEYVTSNAVIDAMFKNKNIFFSEFWFGAIESIITTVFEEKGVRQGLLTPGTVKVTMPNLADYPSSLKLAEVLEDITADAEKTNPISKIIITGRLA